jgi:hypothetical protein
MAMDDLVAPAKAGAHQKMDSGFRRNDGKKQAR